MRHCLAPQAFVSTSSVSLGSATGKTSLTALRLLFPQNPLRWAFAGTLRITSEKSRQKRRLNLRFKNPFRELRRSGDGFHTPNYRSFGHLIYAGYLNQVRLPPVPRDSIICSAFYRIAVGRSGSLAGGYGIRPYGRGTYSAALRRGRFHIGPAAAPAVSCRCRQIRCSSSNSRIDGSTSWSGRQAKLE